jgi:hypothetical protein
MSEVKDDEQKKGEGVQDVCRDFLNNVCDRGSRCKFFHPSHVKHQTADVEEYTFCKDYQVRLEVLRSMEISWAGNVGSLN